MPTTVDASIPLSVQAPQLMTPFQAYAQMTGLKAAQQQQTLRDQEIQQNQIALKDQMALSKAASNSENIDPATGLLKPEALAASGVSPQTTQKMTAAYRQAQYQQAETKLKESETSIKTREEQTKMLHNVYEKAYGTYEDVFKRTGDKNAATEAMQKEMQDGYGDISKTGLFPKDTQFKLLSPEQVYAGLTTHKEREEEANKKAAAERAEQTPFMKESAALAKLVAEGKGNTKEAKDLKKHIDKMDAPARTTIVLPPGITEANKDLHGEEFLKTVKPDEQGTVKAIAEGRETFSSMGYRGADRQRMVKLVNQYDPEFDQGKAPAKFAVRKDFTSGKASQNVTSINTAIGHMATLDELGQELKNKDPKAVNKFVNTVATQLGKPEVNNFELATQAVGDELMRTFRQVGASEREAEAWQARFSSANSPEQIEGAVKVAATLLKSRIDALNDQWKRGMDTDKGYPNLLSAKSRGVMEKFGYKEEGGSTASGAKQTKSADDEKAIAWAKAHGDDPRAKKILALHPGE